MITSLEEYQKQLTDVHNDFIDNVTNKLCPEVRPSTHSCYQLDKPVYILINNDSKPATIIDKGDHYEQTFPCFGFNPKQYTDDFGWVLDDKTVFYIERPYKGRVVKLLRQLLPDCEIKSIHNDLIINNVKIGPCYTGGRILDFTKDINPPSSSLIYCMRWTDVEGLDKYFAGDPNHEKRKNGPTPLGSLDMFIKNMTKQEFERMLENIE
jgi:hypothetical protein